MATEKPKIRQPLIVDADSQFLETLKTDFRATKVPPLVASNGREAQMQIANDELAVAGVFVSINISGVDNSPGAVSVVKFCHQHRPSMPIYLLYEGEPPYDEEALAKMGVQVALLKPVTYGQIVDLVNPEAISFDPAAALERGLGNKDAVGAELQEDERGFIPIQASQFVSGTKSYFGLYVRIGTGKFIKILQAGEAFPPERIRTYLKKGVRYFYLRKEDQEAYLSYCSTVGDIVLKSDKIDVKLKATKAMNHGEETMKFLRSQGLSESNLYNAHVFVDNLHTLVNKMELRKQDLLGKFMADVANYEHGVSTAMIGALISEPLGIESNSIVKIVGLACFLHDVGLVAMPPEVQDENEAKMTEQQKELYRTHPEVGAELLAQVPGILPNVTYAVALHHARRDSKGFPSGNAKNLNQVCEIIGLSNEFVRYIERSKTAPGMDIMQEMQKNVFFGYSAAVVESFTKTFSKR